MILKKTKTKTKKTGNINKFMKQGKQNCQEAHQGFKTKSHVASRERANANINRAPIGAMAKVGHLGLVREAGSIRTREGCGNELHPEKHTDPWTVQASSTDRPRRRKRTAEYENREILSRHLCAKTLQ